MRMEVMTVNQFLNRDCGADTFINRVIKHLDKHKIVYQVVGFSLIIMASNEVFASGIDQVGNKMYRKLINVGKWVIIFKGGWDTVMNAVKNDFDSAKRSFLQYLVIYVILLGLPWALNEVDKAFADF